MYVGLVWGGNTLGIPHMFWVFLYLSLVYLTPPSPLGIPPTGIGAPMHFLFGGSCGPWVGVGQQRSGYCMGTQLSKQVNKESWLSCVHAHSSVSSPCLPCSPKLCYHSNFMQCWYGGHGECELACWLSCLICGHNYVFPPSKKLVRCPPAHLPSPSSLPFSLPW